jgi:adenine-specific DNA methylase
VVIPKECKRLSEVDFPIAEVSRHSAREKSIRYGHPSTLHLWWARRPLAACRAVLLALLLPDPCDEHCPPEFKTRARESLAKVPGKLGPKDEDLRRALLRFIGDFANWDLAPNETYLEASRGLVKSAYGDDPPLVVDPFAGGGSIPLEALRLGCEAFASDLNPVACLILKVMLEHIPRQGPDLAENLRHVGAELKKAAEKELTPFYPTDPDRGTPIAYLWARTVRCEQPDCGAEIPLLRSWWLSQKTNRKRALRCRVERSKGKSPFVKFEIFEPKTEAEVPTRTVSRANATCVCCHKVLPAPRVRAQLSARRGGADVVFDKEGNRTGGAMLLAVVTIKDQTSGRDYRLSTNRDYTTVRWAQERVAALPVGTVPNEPTPAGGGAGAGRAFSVQKYGMMQWADLFTARQRLTMEFLRRAITEETQEVREFLALALSRYSDIFNALCQWESSKTQVRHLFTRQALPLLWDFAEGSPLGGQAGDFSTTLETMIRVIDGLPKNKGIAQSQQADSTASPLADDSAALWFTDPPYYDAIPYSDLSDFFFVWMKRVLPNHPLLRDPYDPANPLTPKRREAVQDETKLVDGKPKDKAFFERTMAVAFREGRRVTTDDGIGCVIFAHKTTEGWEALLSGMIHGGWVITASWPIVTEAANRLRARDSAALATSIHLVCRPRAEEKIGDWATVLRELPGRVSDWMERLQGEGVRGADLVFACIGPALEIFSRYSKVETAEGREVGLAAYLEKVWEVVGRAALEQVLGTAEAKVRNGGAGALEEDARLTALFLWTLQSTNGEPPTAQETGQEEDEDEEESEGTSGKKKKGPKLIFDVVRRFAQPLGIRLPDWEGRIIETEKGIVRLLPVRERTEQLFGEDGAHAVASQLERGAGDAQLNLFPEAEAPPQVRGRKSTRIRTAQPASQAPREATTLDRVHAAMLLQAGGQANALRVLLRTEQQRNPDFLRLANALSALYPKESEEKRLLDAMLLAVPR